VAFLLEGCEAMNSLILHPLHVVAQQHEYNERAAAAERLQGQNGWPTNR
jgi:hypothetical protein